MTRKIVQAGGGCGFADGIGRGRGAGPRLGSSWRATSSSPAARAATPLTSARRGRGSWNTEQSRVPQELPRGLDGLRSLRVAERRRGTAPCARARRWWHDPVAACLTTATSGAGGLRLLTRLGLGRSQVTQLVACGPYRPCVRRRGVPVRL